MNLAIIQPQFKPATKYKQYIGNLSLDYQFIRALSSICMTPKTILEQERFKPETNQNKTIDMIRI